MPSAGLILLDESLRPIYANPEALRILAYPQDPHKVNLLDELVRERLQSILEETNIASNDDKVHEFRSGRRKYRCRAFLLSGSSPRSRGRSVMVIFERSTRGTFDFPAIASRYNLTPRETRTAQLLMYGMTSKEIASHLNISPNTVKAFLRIIMIKMAVTTRAGIVGRILESQLEAKSAAM